MFVDLSFLPIPDSDSASSCRSALPLRVFSFNHSLHLPAMCSAVVRWQGKILASTGEPILPKLGPNACCKRTFLRNSPGPPADALRLGADYNGNTFHHSDQHP